MKRMVILILTVILFMPVTACSENKSGDQEEEPVGGGLKIAAILFDFSNGSPEKNVKSVTHYSYEYITQEELIDTLSFMSGLDFYVTLSMNDDRFIADWAADSTLIAGLDDREQKEDFFFYDADSMRWFMMDSLWRTLGSEIYYTMDGGKELVFDELYPVNVFPADAPYMGSAFYFAHADDAGDFSYIDEEYNLALHYPNSFASEQENTGGYTKRFPSLNGDSVLLHYWVFPNTDGTTPENFYDTTPATIIGTEKNAVYGWGNELNQITGETTVNAYYWLVEKDWIACVAICCPTEAEVFAWCKKIIDDKAVFIENLGKIAEEPSVFSEKEAMDILSGALVMAEGTAIVSYGEEIIDGIHCWTFAYGSDSPEKFTAEAHYAVTDYGRILVFDIETAGYKELFP